ncbi:choice-of-anchor L domain-containing protein [Allohahella sp. A8]|uniref:choice-of-anchor L domain-containing protein n=1 Tax=Allohahella sp. A8 TaxID=3141461 RepID=UPI000C0B538F|nr:PEP-CTERM sorting domain-containing protein [Hahellaceae bacterium]
MDTSAAFRITLITAAIAMGSTSASALVITETSNGQALLGSILGSGVVADAESVNYKGESGQAAFFSGGLSAGIGIDSGILLTSGSASLVDGTNSSSEAGTRWGSEGDADLDALVSGETRDANVLEFDFISTGGDLFFNYVFASEEYNEYVDTQFNDVFAFYVDGINIALVGDDPVSVNTVNCGNTGTASGMNCGLFNNNEGLGGDAAYNIEYDGFTDVFTASITGLTAGTHTMKLAIADRSDGYLDSGVFIQANSFSSVPTPPTTGTEVPVPGSLALIGVGLAGLLARRSKIS